MLIYNVPLDRTVEGQDFCRAKGKKETVPALALTSTLNSKLQKVLKWGDGILPHIDVYV